MADGDFKMCGGCGCLKPRSEFHKSSRTKDGCSTQCKSCCIARARNYTERNSARPDHEIVSPESAKCTCCQEVLPAEEFAKGRSRKNGLQTRCLICHIATRYGLTRASYMRLFERQGGRCAICRGVNPHSWRLSIDHNHVTGSVRGLLCQNCNSALGMLREDPALFARAVEYLKEESSNG